MQTAYISFALIALFGVLLVFLFGDVEKGVHRRPLQNLVRRGFLFLKWALAVWTAVDAGVLAYYQALAKPLPLPQNEAVFPPSNLPVPPPPDALESLPDGRKWGRLPSGQYSWL